MSLVCRLSTKTESRRVLVVNSAFALQLCALKLLSGTASVSLVLLAFAFFDLDNFLPVVAAVWIVLFVSVLIFSLVAEIAPSPGKVECKSFFPKNICAVLCIGCLAIGLLRSGTSSDVLIFIGGALMAVFNSGRTELCVENGIKMPWYQSLLPFLFAFFLPLISMVTWVVWHGILWFPVFIVVVPTSLIAAASMNWTTATLTTRTSEKVTAFDSHPAF